MSDKIVFEIKGKWYLFEKEGENSQIAQIEDDDYEDVSKHWTQHKGWKITPVIVFKKEDN